MLLGRAARAEQLRDLFERIDMTKEVCLKQLEYLDKDAADRSSVLLGERGWGAVRFMREIGPVSGAAGPRLGGALAGLIKQA